MSGKRKRRRKKERSGGVDPRKGSECERVAR